MTRVGFVLVHGAWHDAGAWDLLRVELERRDSRGFAVELPSDDVAVDASGYARVIAAEARAPYLQPCPLTHFPDVPTSAIVMRDDRMIRPEWSRDVARTRLGVEPLELPGGHSPMLADPGALAATLVELGRQR